MKPRSQLLLGLLLIVLVAAASWWSYSVVSSDGIDRRMFLNSPGTVYAGVGYIPLPRLEDAPRSPAGRDAVLRLRRTPAREAIALLGEPDVRTGHQDAVLIWHSAIRSEVAVAGRWPVAHVVSVIDRNEIAAIAVVGSFGTIEICDPPGAVRANP